MIEGKRILAVIPARGGSKRLPRKNLLPLVGKPLIAWTIDAVSNSKYVDEVIVSTDDKEIVTISEEYGASAPFTRPACLSTDTATSHSVILHCLEYVKQNSRSFDAVVLLQPTSPLRTAGHIDAAIEQFLELDAKAVISVCKCDHSPLWSNILPNNKSLKDFIKSEVRGKRSQDLPQYYRLNGAIFIYDVCEYIKSDGDLYGPQSYAFIMDAQSSVDIDTKFDFQLAELILSEGGSAR